jgi:hypothetical protein
VVKVKPAGSKGRSICGRASIGKIVKNTEIWGGWGWGGTPEGFGSGCKGLRNSCIIYILSKRVVVSRETALKESS